jgi:hypothetical protein
VNGGNKGRGGNTNVQKFAKRKINISLMYELSLSHIITVIASKKMIEIGKAAKLGN